MVQEVKKTAKVNRRYSNKASLLSDDLEKIVKSANKNGGPDDDDFDEDSAADESLCDSKSNYNQDWFLPLGICQVFARCFDMFAARWGSYVTMIILLLIPGAALGFGVYRLVDFWEDKMEADHGQIEENLFIQSTLAISGLKLALGELLLFLVFLPGEVVMMGIATVLYANITRANLWTDLKASFSYFCSMFSTAILLFSFCVVLCFCFGLVEMLIQIVSFDSIMVMFLIVLYLVFFCTFFWVWAISLLVFPALMIENLTPPHAIRRSWELSHGRIYYVFCVNMLFATARFVTADLLKDILDDNVDGLDEIPFVVINFLPALLLLPLQANIRIVVYMNIRAEVEGLNESMLQEELGEEGGYLEAAGLLEDDATKIGTTLPSTQSDYVEAGVLIDKNDTTPGKSSNKKSKKSDGADTSNQDDYAAAEDVLPEEIPSKSHDTAEAGNRLV
ncbi:hypothetical protein ACA910_014139 [Epithemia clementina (nom. ined.)]